MDYIYPFTAIHHSGRTLLLRSADDVAQFRVKHGRWGTLWGPENHNNLWYLFPSRRLEVFNRDWIIRDDWGRKVHPADFDPKGYYHPYKNRQKEIARAIEKGLPIPRTGKRNYQKHNAPAMKNGGSGHAARAATKAAYDEHENGVKVKDRAKHIDIEWW